MLRLGIGIFVAMSLASCSNDGIPGSGASPTPTPTPTPSPSPSTSPTPTPSPTPTVKVPTTSFSAQLLPFPVPVSRPYSGPAPDVLGGRSPHVASDTPLADAPASVGYFSYSASIGLRLDGTWANPSGAGYDASSININRTGNIVTILETAPSAILFDRAFVAASLVRNDADILLYAGASESREGAVLFAKTGAGSSLPLNRYVTYGYFGYATYDVVRFISVDHRYWFYTGGDMAAVPLPSTGTFAFATTKFLADGYSLSATTADQRTAMQRIGVIGTATLQADFATKSYSLVVTITPGANDNIASTPITFTFPFSGTTTSTASAGGMSATAQMGFYGPAANEAGFTITAASTNGALRIHGVGLMAR